MGTVIRLKPRLHLADPQAWIPERHPRWPKGTPHAGNIQAGEFMRVSDLVARLASTQSGTQDITFVAKGSHNISSVIARRGDDPTTVNFDVHMHDGGDHVIGANMSTDFAQVMGAMQAIDTGHVERAPAGITNPSAAVPNPNAPNAPAAPKGATAKPAKPLKAPEVADSRVQPLPSGGAISHITYSDGSVQKRAHPSPEAAQRHLDKMGAPEPDKPHGTTPEQKAARAAADRPPAEQGTVKTTFGKVKPHRRFQKADGSYHQKDDQNKAYDMAQGGSHLVHPDEPVTARSGDVVEAKPKRGDAASVERARKAQQTTPRDVTRPEAGATPGAKEAVKTGTIVHTPEGQGVVTKSGAGFATVKHDAGGSKEFANSDLNVPGGTPQAAPKPAVRVRKSSGDVGSPAPSAGGTFGTHGQKYGKGDLRAGQPRPHYGPTIEQNIQKADADKAIRKFPAEPTDKAKGIIPDEILKHPELHTTGATVLMHSDPREDGGRHYTDERQALHDKIVADHFKGAKVPKGKPVALFYAGGSASGKSTAQQHLGDAFSEPEHAVKIDPDKIKTMLPEYNALVAAGDPSGASMTHEESSDLAKRIQAEAMAKGYNIVVDGTGDSGGTKFLDKLRTAATGKLWKNGKNTGTKAGKAYDVHVFMVDAPSDVAVGRAYLRGEKTGRHLPPQMVREMHAAVSRSVATWQEDPHVKSHQMFSTFDPANPDARKALPIAHGGGGKLEITDQRLYDEMMSKGTGKSLHSESQQAIDQSLTQKPKVRVRRKTA